MLVADCPKRRKDPKSGICGPITLETKGPSRDVWQEKCIMRNILDVRLPFVESVELLLLESYNIVAERLNLRSWRPTTVEAEHAIE